MKPLAEYSERLLEVRRRFELHADRVEVEARWLLRGRFHNTVPLATLKRDAKRITVRYRLNFYAGWALAVSLLVAASYWVEEVTAPFSGSKEMAEVLGRYTQHEIAAHGLVQCEAVLPYLDGRRLWYAGLGTYGTHMLWNRAQDEAVNVPYPTAVARARTHFAGQRWLLLLNVEMPDPAANGFRLLHMTREPFEKADERYWLYAPLPMH